MIDMRACLLALLAVVCTTTALSQTAAVSGYRQGEVVVLMKQGDAADCMQSRARAAARSSSHRLCRLSPSVLTSRDAHSSALDAMAQVLQRLDAFELVPLDQPSVGSLARRKTTDARPLPFPSAFTAEEQSLLSRLFLVRYHSLDTDAADAAAMLLATGQVEQAEPNLLVRIAATGEPTLMSDSITHVSSARLGEQWWLHRLNVPELWQQPIKQYFVEDGHRMMIAIIDTGVDTHHPDLQGNVSADGYDFARDTTDVVDFHGHGTHCAGIAAANGRGQLAGACPDALILPITVMDKQGLGSMFDVLGGVVYALRQGAQILSMSLGSYGESTLYRSIMETAVNHSLVFAAAGNEWFCFKASHRDLHGMAAPHKACIPGAFPGVLAVMCTNEEGQLASYSNFDCDGPLLSDSVGAPNYELRAPGDNILSTLPGGTYGYMSGTSMSCPLAAGAVARLVMSGHWPDVAHLVRMVIMSQGDQLDVMAALMATPDQLETPSFQLHTDSVTYFFQRIDSATVQLGDGLHAALTIHRPGLASLTIPDHVRGLAVTTLAPHAFDSCPQLQTIRLGRAVNTLSSEALTGCTALADLYVVTDVPPRCAPGAFSQSQLSTVRLNIVHGFMAPYATSAVWSGFQHRRELSQVTGNRFQHQVTLQAPTSITGPIVQEIPATYIIYNKESLIGQIGAGEPAINTLSAGRLTIPDEVPVPSSPDIAPLRIMVIGEDAFKGCERLTEVQFPSLLQHVESSAFSDCKGLSNVVLPEYVTYIGSQAFAGCESLRAVWLSPRLRTIGGFAFAQCNRLQQLYVPMTTPPELPENAFITEMPSVLIPFNLETMGGNYRRIRLWVPYGCREVYASAPGWQLFTHIEEMSAEAIQDIPLSPSSMRRASSTVYSLTGQQMSPSQRLSPGIYVVNGRKTVVK